MVTSFEVKMVPELPTVTKVSFPWVMSLKLSNVPEIREAQLVPSEEVRMVPKDPTPTNDGDEVVDISDEVEDLPPIYFNKFQEI